MKQQLRDSRDLVPKPLEMLGGPLVEGTIDGRNDSLGTPCRWFCVAKGQFRVENVNHGRELHRGGGHTYSPRRSIETPVMG